MRFLFAAAALCVAGSASAVTVVNGDFEAGNTAFTSDYTYTVPSGGNPPMDEARYSVTTSAVLTHFAFANFGDHTTGTGQYMVVNGSGSANVPVYTSAPIAVATSGVYNFSAFLATVYFESPAMLSFTVTPNVGAAFSIGEFMAPASVGVWQSVGSDFVVAPGVTSLTLSILNQNTDLSGNDFAIDDISLSVVPEPTTWGLLVAGFAMVGAAARRRRRVVAA